MSQDPHFASFRKIIEDEAISPYCMFDFLVPYPFVWSTIRSSGKVHMIVKGGFVLDILAALANLFTILFMAILLLPISIAWRFLTFFVGSWWRLFTSKGGKRGFKTNIWLVCWFTTLMIFVFVPLTHEYVSPLINWHDIGEMLGIV